MKLRFLLLFWSTSALAVIDSESIFSMSLEQLLELKIVTASQEKEKTAESMAIVSVLTANQLKQMGALNLYEALSFAPGIVLNETYIGYTVLTFRGVTPGLYNNKALFMINGHPNHEKMFGSSHLEFIPIDIVDRIEVIRSPASVLYGTNAISGVVNVITKQGENTDESVHVRGGSNSHYFTSGTFHGANMSFSASTQNDKGYLFGGTLDELGQSVSKDYQNDLTNIFVDLYNETWRINAAYYHSDKEKFGLNPIVQQGGINQYQAFYLDINHRTELGGGTINSWLRYDTMERKLAAQNFPDPINGHPISVENSLSRYSGEVNYKTHLDKTLNYIVGINYELDNTDPLLFVDQIDNNIHPFSPIKEKYDTQNFALYAQGQFDFNEQMAGIAGFRLENNSDTGSGFIPRLGVNYQYSENTYIKFLYSEAFRSPAFLEKYADVPGVLLGDISLKREKIDTFELGIDSQLNSNSSIQFTVFHLELDDEITRRAAESGGTEHFNSQGRRMFGWELALSTIMNNSTELLFNASYTDGEEGSGHDAPFIAKHTVNLILTHYINESWSINLSNQYVGTKLYKTNAGEIGKLDPYNLTNLNFTYLAGSYELSLLFKNLLDQKYTYPEPVRRNISEIPGGSDSAVYLSFRYSF